MRRPFIAGNWKMNKVNAAASELAISLKDKIADLDGVDVLVCPPFTALNCVLEAIKGSKIALGAQNIYWQKEGAFTGEVSAQMIKSAGCEYVIIGHSERRKYFSESNQEINKKIKAALAADILPIVCVGETLEEREQAREEEVVRSQLQEGFDSLAEQDLEKITVAYEPVWAIGTGKTATTDQAEQMHAFIREWFRQAYSSKAAENLRILYGGSVKPGNIKGLIGQSNIDGALVGGASLDPETFGEIIKFSVA